VADKRHRNDIAARLSTQGLVGQPLSAEETEQLQERWRRVYAAAVKRQTGEWVHLGYDWHAFSYGFTAAEQGAAAIEAYRRQRPGSVWLIPMWAKGPASPAWVCTGEIAPDLTGLDVAVVPADLSWTMAFTHEDGWIGPFFSTMQQATESPPAPSLVARPQAPERVPRARRRR
jgi:hypothetical protein